MRCPLQAKDALSKRLQQLEVQATASSDQLTTSEATLSSAQQEAAAANAAMADLRQEHQGRMAQLEADLAAAQAQQQTSSQLANEGQIEEQIAARLSGSSCIRQCHDAGFA